MFGSGQGTKKPAPACGNHAWAGLRVQEVAGWRIEGRLGWRFGERFGERLGERLASCLMCTGVLNSGFVIRDCRSVSVREDGATPEGIVRRPCKEKTWLSDRCEPRPSTGLSREDDSGGGLGGGLWGEVSRGKLKGGVEHGRPAFRVF